MAPDDSAGCPFQGERDERKSAKIAAANVTPQPGSRVVRSFDLAREIFRHNGSRQHISDARDWHDSDPYKRPVIFLDGEIHRRRRAAVAKFFTPKAVTTRHRSVIERTTDRLIAEMRAKGEGQLDRMSFYLAVIVTAEVLGLSTDNYEALSKRIDATLSAISPDKFSWFERPFIPLLRRFHAMRFYFADVKPAIAARRQERRDDMISELLEDGFEDQSIMIECLTYGSAGMTTTREFIVMAAWHMFEKEALRERFLASNEDDQIAILEEILRLEPVAAVLHRKTSEPVEFAGAGVVQPDTLFAIDIRSTNWDEAAAGACPHMIDPDRSKTAKGSGPFMSFGDGVHRCPGAQLAIHESRTFLDRLFRVPGIRLQRDPDISWCQGVQSYELRNAIVACDRA